MKTLKDLNFDEVEIESGDPHCDCGINDHRLRQILQYEAIKWVNKFTEELDDRNYDASHILIQWIKEFFNLEDD